VKESLKKIGSTPLIIALAIMLFFSGLSVVYVKDLYRRAFMDLQVLMKKDNELESQWGQLLLEQSTLVTNTRIEKLATNRLSMRVPDQKDITLITS
jgi:cell division protein FtsL